MAASNLCITAWKPNESDLRHIDSSVTKVGVGDNTYIVDVYQKDVASTLLRVIYHSNMRSLERFREFVESKRSEWEERWRDKFMAKAEVPQAELSAQGALELIRDVSLSDMSLDTKYTIIKLICKEQICST